MGTAACFIASLFIYLRFDHSNVGLFICSKSSRRKSACSFSYFLRSPLSPFVGFQLIFHRFLPYFRFVGPALFHRLSPRLVSYTVKVFKCTLLDRIK